MAENEKQFFGWDAEKGLYIIPSYPVETAFGHIGLTWLNARVRTFAISEYNHVEWTNDAGTVFGIRGSEDLIAELQDLQFPESFEPMVDDDTQEWLGNLVMKDIETEWLDGQ